VHDLARGALASIDDGRPHDLDRADPLGHRAVDRRRGDPGRAAVGGAVERGPVGHARKGPDADVAQDAGLVVEEAERAHEGAGLPPDLGPRVAAVVGAVEQPLAVAVPAAARRGEDDVVLLAAIGQRRKLAPRRAGGGGQRPGPLREERSGGAGGAGREERATIEHERAVGASVMG
jgi:hypothetical protein